MSDRPKLMTREERLKLIRAPFSFYHRHEASVPWGGSAIEPHPLPQRPRTPQDQDDDRDEDPGDE